LTCDVSAVERFLADAFQFLTILPSWTMLALRGCSCRVLHQCLCSVAHAPKRTRAHDLPGGVSMADLLLEISGKQFRRAYLLYVIEICHLGERYFYVGQTGDRNHFTARPAFRRLCGHLEDTGQSTQNQVYRYIAAELLEYAEAKRRATLSDKVKQAVEDFLVGSEIRMHVYEVSAFNPSNSRAAHREIVKQVSALETHVMSALAHSGKRLINKRILAPRAPCPYPSLLARVKLDFGIQGG